MEEKVFDGESSILKPGKRISEEIGEFERSKKKDRTK